MRTVPLMVAAVCLVAALIEVSAQAPGVPIEGTRPAAQDSGVLARLEALRGTGKGLDTAGLKAGLLHPTPAVITLPPCHTTSLRPAEVWEAAQRSRVGVGWHYLCHKCDKWHLNLAGGYPIAADGVVATCFHVAEPGSEIREGRLVVVDGEGNPHAVTEVIASSREMDACIVRVEGLKAEPLPLNDQVRPGDPAFLLSNPLNVSGYFTDGMVNRFFWNPKASGAPGKDDFTFLRMNVSTDWAPGSSGSPVLDSCGNAISHVATIAHLGDGKNSSGKGVAHLTLHEGIPARSLKALVKLAADEAGKPEAERKRPTLGQLEELIGAKDYVTAAGVAGMLERAGVGADDGRRLVLGKFRIAVGTGKQGEASELAGKLTENAGAEHAVSLNEVAWKLVTGIAKPEAGTLAAAEKAALRSVELLERRDAASLDTLARVSFMLDKKDEAIRTEEQAVAVAEGEMKAELEKTLAAYREGKLPEVKE